MTKSKMEITQSLIHIPDVLVTVALDWSADTCRGHEEWPARPHMPQNTAFGQTICVWVMSIDFQCQDMRHIVYGIHTTSFARIITISIKHYAKPHFESTASERHKYRKMSSSASSTKFDATVWFLVMLHSHKIEKPFPVFLFFNIRPVICVWITHES